MLPPEQQSWGQSQRSTANWLGPHYTSSEGSNGRLGVWEGAVALGRYQIPACLPKKIKPTNVALHEPLFKNKKCKLSGTSHIG